MEIGLYNAKYPFRKLLNFLLSYFNNTNPNHISFLLIPIGLVTAITYYFAPSIPTLYIIGTVILIFVRMVVGTLDGMVAEHFQKLTPNGAIINRLMPEAADMMLQMLAIIMANTTNLLFATIVLIICWGISYTGLIGLTGGKKIQSVTLCRTNLRSHCDTDGFFRV